MIRRLNDLYAGRRWFSFFVTNNSSWCGLLPFAILIVFMALTENYILVPCKFAVDVFILGLYYKRAGYLLDMFVF